MGRGKIMRIVVAIVLILCGTLLVLAPAVVDFLDRVSVAAILSDRKDLNSVSLSPEPMSGTYRSVCWMLGGAMLLTGTVGGMFGRPCPPPPRQETAR
jgi:hypothetical protein